MRDGGQLQHGGGRAGMIRRGQRGDGLQLGVRGRGVEIALEDEVGLGGDFDGVRAAFHQVDRLGTQQPGQMKGVDRAAAVDVGGQQRGRITPQDDGQRHFFASRDVLGPMASKLGVAVVDHGQAVGVERHQRQERDAALLVRAIDGNQLAGGD